MRLASACLLLLGVVSAANCPWKHCTGGKREAAAVAAQPPQHPPTAPEEPTVPRAKRFTCDPEIGEKECNRRFNEWVDRMSREGEAGQKLAKRASAAFEQCNPHKDKCCPCDPDIWECFDVKREASMCGQGKRAANLGLNGRLEKRDAESKAPIRGSPPNVCNPYTDKGCWCDPDFWDCAEWYHRKLGAKSPAEVKAPINASPLQPCNPYKDKGCWCDPDFWDCEAWYHNQFVKREAPMRGQSKRDANLGLNGRPDKRAADREPPMFVKFSCNPDIEPRVECYCASNDKECIREVCRKYPTMRSMYPLADCDSYLNRGFGKRNAHLV